jgi:hypothetical protein
MPEIPELKITDADLVNVMPDRKLTTPEAKKIIGNTKKVLIEGIEAKEKSRTSTSISLEAPPNLGKQSWSVVLLTAEAEDDEIIAILNYDPVTKEFPAPDDEEDEDEEEEDLNITGQRNANPGRGGRG